MKKLLVSLLIMAMSTSLLIGCGGNESTSSDGDVEQNQRDVVAGDTEEENGMDLSIYPSKNIETYNGGTPELSTHDEMYARVESMIANTETQEFDGSIIHSDANGNNVYCEFMEDGELSTLYFCICDEEGIRLEEYFYQEKGDAKPYQATVRDVNGQDVYHISAYGDGEQAFTIYDYHANGALAHEMEYTDGVLINDTTYNEDGNELVYVGYRDGAEKHKRENSYNDKGLLQTEKSYYEGRMESNREYSYDANDVLVRMDSYVENDGKTLHYDYETYTYLTSGDVETVSTYGLTEEAMNKFYTEGIEPTEADFVLKREVESYENGIPKIEKEYVNVDGEDKLERETEYFETGYRKKETLYATVAPLEIRYSSQGNHSFYYVLKIVTEYHESEYGEMISKCTAYGDDETPKGQVEYDIDGNIIAGKEFNY